MTAQRDNLKQRVRRQSHGWAVERENQLMGVESTFCRACALADRWVRNDWLLSR